jgi:hypothetical protein
MTSASPAETVVTLPVAPEILPGGARWRIFFYLTALFFLLAFASPSGGLIDIPISFLLKNKLHLTAVQVAQFRLIAGLPLFLSWIFGFLRDVWNPFAMGDRGFLVLFGAASAIVYGFFAFTPGYLRDAPRRAHPADFRLPVHSERAKGPDRDAWAAACDVRLDQRRIECRGVADLRGGAPLSGSIRSPAPHSHPAKVSFT